MSREIKKSFFFLPATLNLLEHYGLISNPTFSPRVPKTFEDMPGDINFSIHDEYTGVPIDEPEENENDDELEINDSMAGEEADSIEDNQKETFNNLVLDESVGEAGEDLFKDLNMGEIKKDMFSDMAKDLDMEEDTDKDDNTWTLW